MAHQLAAGQKLGHLTVVKLLGSGGMADVYEAVDGRLGRHVAMKVLPREYSRNQDFIMRFEREVKASAALSHPNIVTVFEFGSEDDLNYYTMRLLNGGDLRDRITKGMTLIEVLMTMRGVLQAFQHAHARGFVHRDVKPENIMFDEMGTPTLTDFGIAKVLDSQTQMTQTGMAVGTPRYISPEQATGKPVDGRSDLYSLGCILFEMLTGSSPYKAETPIATIFQHVNEPIPRLDDEFGAFQPLLDRLMAKSPETRMQNAEEAMEFIDQAFPRDWTGAFGAHTTQGMPAVGAPTPSVTPIRTHTVPAAAPPAGDEAATQLMSTSPGVVDDSGEGKTQFMPTAPSAEPASASGEGEKTMFLPQPGAGTSKAGPSRTREPSSAEGKNKRIVPIAAVLLLVLAAGGYVVYTGIPQLSPADTADEPVVPQDDGIEPTPVKEDTRTGETG
ncbi:MAG: serine/threonine-protein kinase, partial [Oceanococcaceae bacterium]